MKRNVERLMVLRRRVSAMICPVLLTATLANADSAGAPGSGGMSPMLLLFLAFLGVVVLLQLVPALVLFSSLLVSVFKRSSHKVDAAGSEQV
ncbi:MAG: hypothetical protein P1S46_01590 [bacterium]|nr:hypothetical protein [bacterium]MDT8395170.1 hypothetical protein [bacterium]